MCEPNHHHHPQKQNNKRKSKLTMKINNHASDVSLCSDVEPIQKKSNTNIETCITQTLHFHKIFPHQTLGYNMGIGQLVFRYSDNF